jgi:hypothetical protein
LAADILDHIPSWRTDQTIVFDPSDLERPLGSTCSRTLSLTAGRNTV